MGLNQTVNFRGSFHFATTEDILRGGYDKIKYIFNE